MDAKVEINQILVEVASLLQKCTVIADANGVDFRYDGPSYGMGGYYTHTPKKATKEEKMKEMQEKMKEILREGSDPNTLKEMLVTMGEELEDDDYWDSSSCYRNDYGWSSSSSAC